MALILVVDPSPTFERVIEAALTQAGYDAKAFGRGEEALSYAKKHPPALTLISSKLTDGLGIELCRRFGRTPSLRETPIIFLKSPSDGSATEYVRALGVVDIITKPVAADTLVAVIDHVLKKAGGRSPEPLRHSRTPADALPRRMKTRKAQTLVHGIIRAVGGPSLALEKVQRAVQFIESKEGSSLLRDVSTDTGQIHDLSGNLNVVPIAEVLQLLSLQRQQGQLRCRKNRSEITIHLSDGKVRLVTGHNMPDEFLLGNILVQEGLIESSELDLFLSNRRGGRLKLGSQAVRLGYLEMPSLHTALKRQSSELVYELLRWKSGVFVFEGESHLPTHVQELGFELPLDNLLMEGFRRVDEWALIESVLPSLDAIPLPLPKVQHEATLANMTPDERAVLDLFDGRSSVRMLSHRYPGGTFELARILYRLVSAKLAVLRQLDPGA